MDNRDKSEFFRALKDMQAATNGTFSMSDNVYAAYWEALKDLPKDKVLQVFKTLSVNEEGHQAPAKIASLISGKKKSSARDSFSFYVSCIAKHGMDETKSTMCDDPKAQAAFKAVGGARAFNTNDVSTIRARYYSEYDNAK